MLNLLILYKFVYFNIMVAIYILYLECNKYYVGMTININFRLNNHFNNNGSYWTIKYKPISIYKIYYDCSIFDEDKYTIEMMSKYGIDNVRGGSFTRINLPDDEIRIITKMINNAKGKCFNCYLPGHYSNKCIYNKVSNHIMITLRNEIIEKCIRYDIDNHKCINIFDLIKILIEIDCVIFDKIIEKDIRNLCSVINNSNIYGIDRIDHQSNTINYIDFSIGITTLLDKQLQE